MTGRGAGVAETGFDTVSLGGAKGLHDNSQGWTEVVGWRSVMPKHRAKLRVAEAALMFAALGDETRLAWFAVSGEGAGQSRPR